MSALVVFVCRHFFSQCSKFVLAYTQRLLHFCIVKRSEGGRRGKQRLTRKEEAPIEKTV